MVNEILERNRTLIRLSLEKISSEKVEITDDDITNAIKYSEHNGDMELLGDKLKERGAIGIRKTQGKHGYETYVKQRTAEKIDSGEYEKLNTGLLNKISGARAQLTTNKTQHYEYLDATLKEIEDTEAITQILDVHRGAGGYDEALADADTTACVVDSGPLFVDWKADHLQYTALNPANVHFKYHSKIVDNGLERGVDYTDLEDAAVMVITLSDKSTSVDTRSYLAIYGRSDDYPLGRHVYFNAQNWYDLPEKGDPDVIDWKTTTTGKGYGIGEIANPLSVYAHETGIPVEYPLVNIRGGIIRTTANSPLPVTDSIYHTCREFDVAFSRLMRYALDSALGLRAVSTKGGEDLPRCLSGATSLHEDQALQLLYLPIENAKGAMEVVTQQSRIVAEGLGVPSYLVVSQETPESGIALSIRTKPLADELDRRGKLNVGQIGRLFEIERGLYNVFSNPRSNIVPEGIQQVWKPGRYIYPESQMEKEQRLKTALDNGAISYIRYVRDYHDLATDRQAMAYIDKMKEQAELEDGKYAAPSKQQEQPANPLTQGLMPRVPRQVNF